MPATYGKRNQPMKWQNVSASYSPAFIYNRAVLNFGFLSCHLITWFSGHLVEPVPPQSSPCKAWGPKALRKKGILNLRFFTWPYKVMWVNWWLPVTISYHPTKFGDHRRCRRGDFKFLIWHMTSCDRVIRESCDGFIMDFTLPYVSTLRRLVAIRLLEE